MGPLESSDSTCYRVRRCKQVFPRQDVKTECQLTGLEHQVSPRGSCVCLVAVVVTPVYK